MTTCLVRGAERRSTVFISCRRRSSLVRKENDRADANVGVATRGRPRTYKEEERERQKGLRRERGKEKKLDERFVGTKGRRRDGADSANAGRPDAFSRPFYIASPPVHR